MLELQRNLYVLRRWWWLLLAALVVGGAVAYGLTKVLAQQQYEGTAVLSLAPAPQGPNGLYVTMLAASADAQLVPTLSTARAALGSLPTPLDRQVDPDKLSKSIDSSSSLDGQLLFIGVKWPDSALAPRLANAVAAGFVRQERRRLETRYAIIHRGLMAQEQHLANLISTTSASGPARSWLQAQYADTASKIYQQDADARIQASIQESSLQLTEPASSVVKVGPKASLNGALGGALAFLIALVFAFVATGSYGQTQETEGPQRVLTKVGD